ncbi:LysR family transcriptional regulator [Zobellella denitrificans]|jgi:DNA-binding transcriptional LysR family regulator|uniref:LysR family transcriptional regulator n=1 Tax=Zobellella denitrificans TaxID=347534 RepID=A0A231N1L2_9GAMM|nr:LysR family transcriptional regulator [Zobellella denitrificans]ATG74394.1 LysR family transcriptional regulator [Zobellella denitrificans]OXS16358.1 LysR family transcriptional regulator [Zobellella denitrificans]
MYRPKSTVEQWRIFQAVVDCGGYAQAAEKLNKSQSSLNHAVAKLQQSLGLSLLEVRGRKAFLTPEGEVFLRRSRKLTHDMENLEQLADVLASGWEPILRIVVEASLPRRPLYQALAEFAPRSRGCRIHLVEAQPAGCRAVVAKQAADLLFACRTFPGVTCLPLAATVYVPVCAPDHPLTRFPAISAHELEHELELVLADGSEQEEGWDRAELRWIINHLHDALSLLRRGIGYAWLPQEVVSPLVDSGQLQQLPMVDLALRKRFTHLILPRATPPGPAASLLLTLTRQHYGIREETTSAS